MTTNHTSENQVSEQDKDIIDTITSGLDKLDDYFNVNSPSLSFFESMVKEKKTVEKSKLVRDLLAFFVIAIAILSILTGTLMTTPVVFIAIQAVAITLVPLYLFIAYRYRKQADIHDA